MRERYNIIEAEYPRCALDSMRGTEYGINGFAFARCVLQLQQGIFHIGKQVSALGDESLVGGL